MADLPISSKQHFKNFSFDLSTCLIKRTEIEIDGLFDKDEEGEHIAFIYGCDIKIGDVIEYGNKSFIINNVQIDNYEGEPNMLKAYY
jgi:hypothetical protein